MTTQMSQETKILQVPSVERCVQGLAETIANTNWVTLDPHEMHHKYKVFKVGSAGSHQISTLGRNPFNSNATFWFI